MKTLYESGELTRGSQEIEEELGAPVEGSGWKAEVWRLGEKNLNGRVYTEELARRLIEEGKATVCYDGHESSLLSGLEYGNAVAVASSPRIEGGSLVVDVDFTDRAFEAKVEALSGAGVPIGVSSVGLGDVEGDGTVVPETYELVRWLDFVTSPAGGVHAVRKESEPDGAGSPASDAVPSAEGGGLPAGSRDRVAEALVRHIGVIL